MSARAAVARRDTIGLSSAESDARAEAASAVEDLQQRLEKEEKLSEQYKKQIDVLQSKLEDATKESGKMEEKAHELEELIETLRNEKREATRQIREMETIYEAEKSSILKEKEEMSNKEEEMQTVIKRLKDSLAQRNNPDDDGRPSRQGKCSISPRTMRPLVLTTFQPTPPPRSMATASRRPPLFSAATRAAARN